MNSARFYSLGLDCRCALLVCTLGGAVFGLHVGGAAAQDRARETATPAGMDRAAVGHVRGSEADGRLWVYIYTRSVRGKVFCALWRGSRGYPTDPQYAVAEAYDGTLESRPRGGMAVMAFDGLNAGPSYALACFHDENGNNDLDRTLVGLPTEGTGASNNARGTLGPPPFRRAAFRMPNGEKAHRISFRIRYDYF